LDVLRVVQEINKWIIIFTN